MTETEVREIVAHVENNVAYLPQPNTVELVLTSEPPPPELTRTSFMVPITEDGGLVLAHNRKRGIEFAGGHINNGETARQAAMREGVEETGATCSDIVQIGYLRMRSAGKAPPEWGYPHPEGYQVFHAGRVVSMESYVENEECTRPEVFSPEDIENIDGNMGAKARILHAEAIRALGL